MTTMEDIERDLLLEALGPLYPFYGLDEFGGWHNARGGREAVGGSSL